MLALALIDPLTGNHVAVCPLALSGLDFCPGCGLGRSVSHLLHGQWRESWAMHPLGIPAFLILTYRIYSLTLTHIRLYGQSN
ncbi:MAG: DUF2752 domain-containing protein [Cyclobacteriaceae bacterium]|nr:DUF2752 domain-containing protein [Cyclobacteriaceae bacterium]